MQRIGVIGCGLMGSGIAELCARNSLDVVVHEVNASALELGKQNISHSISRAVSSEKLTEHEGRAVLGRMAFTTSINDLADRDLVIEAVTEDEQAKIAVFSALDKVLTNKNAILASNTSSIPIMKLAMATRRPQNVVGMHFFNPVPVIGLVELVSSLLTSTETAQAAAVFALDQLGKEVINSKDRAGFIVNALLVPYILSAIRMLESGFATSQDIDAGMVKGCAHPMGPLALADLIGIDTIRAVSQSLYEEFKEPMYSPPPLLCRMAEAGLLGRKTGKGFYSYAA
jgi:3-hydroxybutyryl-CoA dehydrogenase